MQRHLHCLLTAFCLLFTQILLSQSGNSGTIWYRDADADGYGAQADSVRAVIAPAGYAGLSGDCNDQDPAVHPGAHEVCNNQIDDNCNGVTDEDATPPIAACKPFLEMNIDSSGVRPLQISDIDNGSFDVCSALHRRLSRAELSCADTGLQVVTLYLQDAAGNTNFCEGRIRVKNTVKFKALCKPDLVLFRDDTGAAQLLPGQVDARSCGTADTVYLNRTVFGCADSAVQKVTLTLKNPAGDSSICHTKVILKDTLAPRARCKPATDLFLDEQGTAVLIPEQVDAGSADACAPITWSLNKTAFDCLQNVVQNVVLSVRDTAGNTGFCTSAVTLRDTIPPRARCAAGQNLYLNDKGEALLLPSLLDAGSDDGCGVAVMGLNRARFFCKDIGNQKVTLSVTDLNGNRSSCSATVQVRDTLAPKAFCREKINLPLDPGGTALLRPDSIDLGSTDACTPVGNRTLSRASFSCADLGRQIVTLTVKDTFGNAASCNAIVSIIDMTVPRAQCRQDLVLNLDEHGEAVLRPQDLNSGSSDPCGMDSLWTSHRHFTCEDKGLQRVILFVSDGSGNQSACQANVNIVDPLPPAVRCRNDVPIFLGPDGKTTVPFNDVHLSSSDNCGTVNFSMPRRDLTCADTGFQILRLFVSDASGNVNWCEATAWVFDTTDTDRDGVLDCSDACPFDPAKNALAAYYKDEDGDGLGAGNPVFACETPPGLVDNNKDCNDIDPLVLCPTVPDPIGGDEVVHYGVDSRGLANQEPHALLKMYPDPASTALTLEWPGEAPRQIAILDLTGRLLQTRLPNGNKTILELEALSPGVYVARIQWMSGKTEARTFRKMGR